MIIHTLYKNADGAGKQYLFIKSVHRLQKAIFDVGIPFIPICWFFWFQ